MNEKLTPTGFLGSDALDAWELKVDQEIRAFLKLRAEQESKYVPAEDEQGK